MRKLCLQRANKPVNPRCTLPSGLGQTCPLLSYQPEITALSPGCCFCFRAEEVLPLTHFSQLQSGSDSGSAEPGLVRAGTRLPCRPAYHLCPGSSQLGQADAMGNSSAFLPLLSVSHMASGLCTAPSQLCSQCGLQAPAAPSPGGCKTAVPARRRYPELVWDKARARAGCRDSWGKHSGPPSPHTALQDPLEEDGSHRFQEEPRRRHRKPPPL